jgi:hypothetical protein
MVTACSLGLSAISQQYFSLRTNQPPATSRNQPAVLFSQNKPAPAISHQPTEQAVRWKLPLARFVGFVRWARRFFFAFESISLAISLHFSCSLTTSAALLDVGSIWIIYAGDLLTRLLYLHFIIYALSCHHHVFHIVTRESGICP